MTPGAARRLLGVALLLLFASAGCRSFAIPPGGWPDANVLLIVLDTHRFDRFGCYGRADGLTPFLDRLAERSVVFHRAYATAPWTEPSVASLLTSRMPSQHGVVRLDALLRPEETTLPEVLRARGVATHGVTSNLLIAEGRGFERGFDEWIMAPLVPTPVHPNHVIAAGGELMRAYAVDWVADRPAAERASSALLYLQYMDTHYEMLPDQDVLEAVARRRGDWPLDMDRIHGGFYFPDAVRDSPRDVAGMRDYYDAAVGTLDRRLAGLFDDLERLGFLDRAVVVVTADHGEELFDHGQFGHGHSLYDELVHVPLLVTLPGQRTRIDVDDVVSLLDVAPTILDLLAVAPPPSFEGRSLRAAIDAAAAPVARLRRAVGRPAVAGTSYAELLTRANTEWPRLTPHRRAVVQAGRKFVEHLDGTWHVFDLTRDPTEAAPSDPAPADLAALAPARAWLDAREATTPEGATQALTPEETERLRALGYVH